VRVATHRDWEEQDGCSPTGRQERLRRGDVEPYAPAVASTGAGPEQRRRRGEPGEAEDRRASGSDCHRRDEAERERAAERTGLTAGRAGDDEAADERAEQAEHEGGAERVRSVHDASRRAQRDGRMAAGGARAPAARAHAPGAPDPPPRGGAEQEAEREQRLDRVIGDGRQRLRQLDGGLDDEGRPGRRREEGGDGRLFNGPRRAPRR
jgi:hypothetical protein